MPAPSDPAPRNASRKKVSPSRRKSSAQSVHIPLAYTNRRSQVIVSLTNLQAGLTHVQNGLTELLQAYIQHTASILAGGADNIEALRLPPQIAADANAVVEAAQTASNAVATAITGPGDNKKKRKREKKERDPNAPKRPLTAAFLYAQSARPIVKSDLEGALGPDQVLEPNAVNLEVNKRWNEMSEEDKEVSDLTLAVPSRLPFTDAENRNGKHPTATPWRSTRRNRKLI